MQMQLMQFQTEIAYRYISYFLFNTQEYFKKIKNLAIEWIKINYETFIEFFGDD